MGGQKSLDSRWARRKERTIWKQISYMFLEAFYVAFAKSEDDDSLVYWRWEVKKWRRHIKNIAEWKRTKGEKEEWKWKLRLWDRETTSRAKSKASKGTKNKLHIQGLSVLAYSDNNNLNFALFFRFPSAAHFLFPRCSTPIGSEIYSIFLCPTRISADDMKLLLLQHEDWIVDFSSHQKDLSLPTIRVGDRKVFVCSAE